MLSGGYKRLCVSGAVVVVKRQQCRALSVGVATLPELTLLFRGSHPPPLVIDVRDPEEVLSGKGGPPHAIEGSVNVPLNHEGIGQRERLTTLDEFMTKIQEKHVNLPRNKGDVIVTHCGSGGRGGKAAALLRRAGYVNAVNGGGPSIIASAIKGGIDSGISVQ